MTDFHPALSVGIEEDLLPLSVLLQRRGVAHRIFEDQGRQVLAVQQAAQAPQVRSLYQAWRAGEVRIEPVGQGGFLLFYFGAGEVLAYLTFTPFELVDGKPVFDRIDGQYWRLVTPAFLHFGWLHIVFNSLWLWELGGKVERVLGHLNMFLLFVVIAMVSNASQFAFGGDGLFGGMSGVVYGLLGFSWVAPLLQPAWRIQPSPALMLFMVGWLVLCMVGVVEVLGFGAIANAAHLGGLLCGALLGAIFGLAAGKGSS
jgi:GlpG protein